MITSEIPIIIVTDRITIDVIIQNGASIKIIQIVIKIINAIISNTLV